MGTKKKKVVIVGGGFAGSTIARALEKEFDVTLIDIKEYFEFTPSIIRVIVEPEHLKKIQVLHKTYLKKARVIIGEVTSITSKDVQVNKENIPFDYLALCSGSSYASPIKESHTIIPLRAKSLFTASKKLQNAKKVMIIGGGLVGVELAAEIREKYPSKEITLVHAHPGLLERHHPRTQSYVLHYCIKNNIQIRTNTRVIKKKSNTYFTDTKEKIKADLAFFCTGIAPNSDYLKRSPLKNFINTKRQIEVNPFLQLSEFPHIFSAGDINAVPLEKTAQNAEYQAEVIVYNIRAMKNHSSLRTYQKKQTPIVISLGKKRGVFEHNSLIITGFIPSLIKKYIEWKEMRKYR